MVLSALIFLVAIVLPVSKLVDLRLRGSEVVSAVDHPLGAYSYLGSQYFNNIQALLAAIPRYHLIEDAALRDQQRVNVEQLRDVLHAQFSKLATSPEVNPKLRHVPGYAQAYERFRDLDADLDALVAGALGDVHGMNMLFIRFKDVREPGLRFLNDLRAAELQAFDAAFASRLAQQRAELQNLLLLVVGLGVLALACMWMLNLAAVSHERGKRALAEARRSIQQRTMLFDAVSHELRTPLQILGAKIELVQMQESVSGRAEALDDLYDTVERMSAVLDNLSRFPRAAASAGPVKLTDFSLRDLLERLVAHHAGAAKVAGKRVELDVGPEIGMIRSDESRLLQIVDNYLQNAIRYSSPGAIAVRAVQVAHEFVPRKTTAALQVSVEDEGPGISEEDRERIWEPFERVTRPAGDKKGMGLGLALVHMLARYAGWETGLSSTPGSGSRFYVILPLEEAVESR